MENDTKKKSKAGRIAALIIIGAVIAACCMPAFLQYREKEQKKATVEACRDYFTNEIPNDLREAYADFSIPGTLDIKPVSSWTSSSFSHKPVYRWVDTLTVTLVTDSSFEELEDREKYNAISDFGWTGIDTFQEVMAKKFPGYLKYGMTIGAYDRTVLFDINYNFYIRSPKRTYRYLMKEDCYGIGTGGLVHYLTDPQSKYYKDPDAPTPTPKPTATPRPPATYTPGKQSSLYGRETDPDEADLFDDPDDYADYYAEEFAEEMGVDVDEGYMEAYDHWNYWHELHD